MEALKRIRRKHADWWSWPDKAGKELNVIDDFFRELESKEGLRMTEYEAVKNDPPDFIATMIDDSLSRELRVGIELTELVNKDAITAQINNDKEYVKHLLDWGGDKISTRVCERVEEKESKCRNVSACYDRMFLVLHTNEPALDAKKVEDALRTASVPQSDVFDATYIFFGYHPMRGYELTKL